MLKFILLSFFIIFEKGKTDVYQTYIQVSCNRLRRLQMTNMEVKEIEFSKLRHAYVTVKTFLESESWEKVKSLDTKIENDLGMAGDDNLELLEKFVEKFQLDYQNFNYSKHFLSEGELFNHVNSLLTLLTLSVWIPLKTIELISLNKIKLEKPNFNNYPEREDLTFREMITWYLEKDYVSNESLKYKIKPEA